MVFDSVTEQYSQQSSLIFYNITRTTKCTLKSLQALQQVKSHSHTISVQSASLLPEG